MLGPAHAQIGDVLAVLVGLSVLIALRPQGDNTTFEVVGVSYVHGLNWGEALLGPMSLGWRFVEKYESNGWWAFAFK